MSEAISVIMPTSALRPRGQSLMRAIDSVLSQEGVTPIPIVVVNGPKADPQLTKEIEGRAGVKLVRQEEADLPKALKTGRAAVQTQWFAELDDDDELLPGALAVRLSAFTGRPHLGAVVSNGFVRTSRGDTLNISDVSRFNANPLRALTFQNWMIPCSGLFRSSAFTLSMFDGIPQFMEWTYLAIRIASSFPVHFLNHPTFIYNANTTFSRWNSRECRMHQPVALKRLLELELPIDVRACFERRLAAACHDLADLLWQEGDLRQSILWHLRSVRLREGWRYMPFTARILVAPFGKARVNQ
jgi:glycosyltransferase involved in cell wall biosynthesis